MSEQAENKAKVLPIETVDAPTVPNVPFPLLRGAMSDNGATPWIATLGLGTPPLELRFMLDTGTLNTWITASACSTTACQLHNAFNPKRSSTYVPGRQPPTSVSFGPWGCMGVVLGNDTCHLQIEHEGTVRTVPLNEPLSIYLSVCYDGRQFAELDCDGGLAIPAIPSERPSSLLEQLKHQGLIEYAIASFHFDAVRGHGSCRMGAVDTCEFEPDTLNVLPVEPLEGDLNYLWNVCLQRLECAGIEVTAGTPFVLDTGSSRFKGGKTVIDRLQAAITDNGQRRTAVTSEAALADYPDLNLTLNGLTYVLTPQQYFLRLSDSLWELGVHYLEGLPDELLLVGSVFLDTVYSIFYYETPTPGQRAVGLATPIFKKLSISGVWENEFGSTLEIGPVAEDGTFRGTYRSHTGATGVYPVMGVADPQPTSNNLAVSFSVTWRSLEGKPDPSWHWVSGFTGLLEENNGQEIMRTMYLLQQDATNAVADWMATAVYPSNFHRKGEP
jgi:hypothetical protein